MRLKIGFHTTPIRGGCLSFGSTYNPFFTHNPRVNVVRVVPLTEIDRLSLVGSDFPSMFEMPDSAFCQSYSGNPKLRFCAGFCINSGVIEIIELDAPSRIDFGAIFDESRNTIGLSPDFLFGFHTFDTDSNSASLLG